MRCTRTWLCPARFLRSLPAVEAAGSEYRTPGTAGHWLKSSGARYSGGPLDHHRASRMHGRDVDRPEFRKARRIVRNEISGLKLDKRSRVAVNILRTEVVPGPGPSWSSSLTARNYLRVCSQSWPRGSEARSTRFRRLS